MRDVFGGIRVVIPKAETRGPEEIRNPNAEWSVITPDGNSLALLKDTWASAGPGIVRHMEWASDPFSLSLTDPSRALRGIRARLIEKRYLVFDHVYTTVDAEAEPFDQQQPMASGIGTRVLDGDVNYGFHVQQSRWPFRRCQDHPAVRRLFYPGGATRARFSIARCSRRSSSRPSQHHSTGGPERAPMGCSLAQRHLRRLQAGSHHGLRIAPIPKSAESPWGPGISH